MAFDTEAERGRAPPCCWRPDDVIERHIRAREDHCRSATSGSSSRWTRACASKYPDWEAPRLYNLMTR